MDYFEYREGQLWAEEVRVAELVERFGTPLYIYSAKTLTRHFLAFDAALKGLDHLTCFSVKANSNVNLLRHLGTLGAGVDIVSGGELYRAVRAGIAPAKIVFSGVGKQAHEIREALSAGILMFNVESSQELECIGRIAQEMQTVARISIRINPDVDPKTHPYISTGLKENKFGLDMLEATGAYLMARKHPFLDPVGMDCHIGSQLTQIGPIVEALEKLLVFTDRLHASGIAIRYLDLGGGLGITYDDEQPPLPADLGRAISTALAGRELTVILEPGRAIAGNAGIMVTRVLYTKKTPMKHFVIVDAAMNDLVRPSLYGAYHRICEVTPTDRGLMTVDVVGPICESGDFLAQNRLLPALAPGDTLAVFSAGAYGFSMASQYNSRPRSAEVLVDGEKSLLVRRRETYEDLIALEVE
ncbi:diaminopimelate decarboxylase [Desulfosarcina ovata]|uniref:Diaminopimelate decarboxylase n=1 Tax=Desulfosarcina ovata subsp. ovata TaxID=2752305 RepID=A0A5K8ADM2_9BACT|nr:diaminopimelate decarboxylase [Desulfosarcina ovata]BBO90636.1 diaminopimelate decarboxylase [Desulfosarcina ovata subsp. ovata]